MDLTSWVVWAILVAYSIALGFIGFWFSLRSLRLFTGVTALILTVAVTRFGLTHPEYAHANLVDSFLSGADQVVIALLHPLWRGQASGPGVAGRWLIAVALLLGYRQLEAWSLRWQAPELDLSALGQTRPADAGSDGTAAAGCPTPAQRHAQLSAELRFRLPTMEIRSPAILPGGTRTNALASIAETSGLSGAGMISAVLRFAGMFWPTPQMVRVRTWVESVSPTRITVLLEDVKTGLPIATNTATGDSFHEAASMVAGYIARQIFSMDRTVPEWCFGTSDGRDLGAMQLVRLERVYAACPRDVSDSRDDQIAILSRSTGTIRTAGIVRYELAQLLALQRQHLESLRLHALNRQLHPRLTRGRYRLAMSLEMIANREHCLENAEATWAGLTQTLQYLARCGLTDPAVAVSTEYQKPDGTWAVATAQADCPAPWMRLSPELAVTLLDIAAGDLRQVRTMLSVSHVVWNAISRRKERAVWLPHWRHRHRQAFLDGIYVAELLIAVRRRLLKPEEEGPGSLTGARGRWHLRRATAITSSIVGDAAQIRAVLADPRGQWWTGGAGTDGRRRRWQRTVSWQAAYNTACLYAALGDAARASRAPGECQRTLERQVITSLRQVVENPLSELERPSDWIYSDPDFGALLQNSPVFQNSLLDQLRQDYPVASIAGKCPVRHAGPASDGPADRADEGSSSAATRPAGPSGASSER